MTTFINIHNQECVIQRKIVRTRKTGWYCSNGEFLKFAEWSREN